ncbi:Antibiotic biosynthesis monooxygenase (plasmid) [Rhizobium leguminosarum bv. trifolii WSM2304]|uniref:Antibiotic biosynthesis monooxygenase n=1 Tax=Rhizobium leguminosarum bv. trifolii (strain WSM2304) TaxID=395492 RepID=A0ABF7QUP9_RHILW|nr:putative quinol monooxygenase [Rhizobium leguminosarum]ACI58018.1 Antibiotic biosynthesis monooxygenase [Rhizobium leguminosarum bv. trifolii WSM2304]
MTITIIGTVVGRPDTRDELERLLAAQVEPTRSEPGCINYDFHVDANDECIFIFYENWASQADLDAHMLMPHLAPLMGQIDRLLAEPITIRHLRMISSRTADEARMRANTV